MLRRASGVSLRAACAAAAIVAGAVPVAAQDLEPRAYASSPVGATFLVLGVSRSSGSVVVDPTLPVSDIEAGINGVVAGVARTFAIGDRLALASAALPYAWGTVSGRVGENAQEVHRSGLTDMRAKLSVNLVGPRAMTPKEFAAAKPGAVVGASLTMAAPSGQYDPEKLINLGTNRWAFKPEVGVSYPLGRWDLDAYLGVWLFTDNGRYYPGTSHRTQGPVYTTQFHFSRSLTRRSWLAFNATFYAGGRTTVDGGPPSERQSNSRLGATLAVPAGQRKSLKFFYNTGASTRKGTDFDTFGAAFQMFWLD